MRKHKQIIKRNQKMAMIKCKSSIFIFYCLVVFSFSFFVVNCNTTEIESISIVELGSGNRDSEHSIDVDYGRRKNSFRNQKYETPISTTPFTPKKSTENVVISKFETNINIDDFDESTNSLIEPAVRFSKKSSIQQQNANINRGLVYTQVFPEEPFSFDTDLMVFVHMQKTGGTTFGKSLINSLRHCVPFKLTNFGSDGRPNNDNDAETLQRMASVRPYTREATLQNLQLSKNSKSKAAKKHCYRKPNSYLRPGASKYDTWLISRLSTGWDCGVHASFSAFQECLPKLLWKNLGTERYREISKNLYFITSIRNPIDRYISEWKHYARGAIWADSRMLCGGKEYEKTIPSCFGENWKGVSLKTFTDCPYGLASNRQVRMLSNLGWQCYQNVLPINLTSPDYHYRMNRLLESAKANLEKKFSFFLVNEYRPQSQYLFEHTFGVKFQVKFHQRSRTRAQHVLNNLSKQELDKVRALNQYDIKLYKFAKRLFYQRVNYFRKLDRRSRRRR